MNSNRRVFRFVVYSVGLFLLLSIADYLFNFGWLPVKRINLLSDIVVAEPAKSTPSVDTITPTLAPIAAAGDTNDFNLYQQPRFITDFNADTSLSSLPLITKKMFDLKAGKKTKIRIAYFGDSMIEGDLLTQTLRTQLQQTFGGSGVGFVPVTSAVSQFRQTVAASYSDGWEDENFKNGKSARLFLSGHLFRSAGDWVKMTDRTIHDSAAVIEKSLLCGKATQPITVKVNGGSFVVHANSMLNRIVLRNDKDASIHFSIATKDLPVYGISFESESGIFVDNLSFRGITGIEFAGVDSLFLKSIAENNPYDLIIFQYGVNLLFRPNDKNFNWYAKALMPVIRRLRNCFPSTDFLLVSTADRAFRYGQDYKSAVGIDSLVKLQALLAYSTQSSFYNQFASMGGANSIVDWAKRKPSLANQDYVHPNNRGAELLANYFFEALMNDYAKYIRSLR